MSREHSVEPKKSSHLDGAFAKPQLPAHSSKTANPHSLDGPSSTVQSNTATPVQSIPLSTPKMAPIELSASDGNSTESSATAFPGWGSSRRPPSPTKGLGGFVESAMMKRSDSVSKRWSVQAATGLKRGDSVASNRSTLGAAGAGAAPLNSESLPRRTRPVRPLSSSSPTGSRPTSSYGVSKLALPPETFSPEAPFESNKKAIDTALKYDKSQDTEDTTFKSQEVSSEHVLDEVLPVSPTKTMDSRRWSPTKSSWLESALARPESPKILPPKSEEPAWKSSMHKAKASIGSPTPATFEVNTTSLLRSPPIGANSRPLSISGMPGEFSSGTAKKSPEKSKPATIAEPPRPKEAESEYVRESRHSDSIDGLSIAKAKTIEAPRAMALTRSDPIAASPTSIKRDPQPIKAKPATPPKTDFRSALKSRQVASSGDSNAEPEFKAVFGKLKRAQTKNYVAPDELKDNITRGKAGLSLTGGPQKTKRVDDFKESILQKKEAMKEGTGLIARPSIRERPAPVVPEALSKKEAMKAVTVVSTKPTTSERPAPVVPETLAMRHLLGNSASTGSEPKTTPVKPEIQLAAPVEIVRPIDPLRKTAKPAAQDKLEKLPAVAEPTNVSKPLQEANAQKQELANSKLASRLNPALAGFLSRGASPKTSNSLSPAASTEDLYLMPRGLSGKVTNESEEAGGATLTHMTKARAKGPKRRAPKAECSANASAAAAPVPERETSVFEPSQDVKVGGRPLPKSEDAPSIETASSSQSIPTPLKVDPTPPSMSTPRPLASVLKVRNQPEQHESTASKEIIESNGTSKDKPVVVAKSPELKKVSPPTPKTAAVADKPVIMTKSPELLKVTSPIPKPVVTEPLVSPSKDRTRSFDVAQDRSRTPTDKPVTNIGGWNKSSTALPVPSPLAPSTTKLNTARSPSTSSLVKQRPSNTLSTKPVSGLGLNLAASPRKEVVPTTTELTASPEDPQPLSFKKSLGTDGATERENLGASKLRGSSHPKVQFRDFFDQTPKAHDKADFDTQAIMSPNKNFGQKMKTLNTTIWEITGNGKKEPMPAQQEHILFEASMYLCVHAFQPESGSKSTEAHLWVGDAVSEAAVEDAQLFCRKNARENSAKLEVLQQGKETASFFQALGGIVITRRNKHSALYMLRGRRHLGHIAFDEVDLEASSLCSGFPYIISAKFGKLFLWKGRGSTADELGCARLIGMDLGLTGEIEEINEGEEPKAFWDSFASKKRSQSSDLWDLKSTQDAYACRLYRVEMERPKSATGFWGRRSLSPSKSSNRALVEEISPFSQGDLSPHHIYLLDAYFEIYVYVSIPFIDFVA
jgi:hypothetical protein